MLGVDTSASTKSALRDTLRSDVDGEQLWQRIQGLVYGRHIRFARVHSGVHEFIRRARVAGHEVFIVSHKTQFGHQDESKTPLRDTALSWLTERGIVGDGPQQIPQSGVLFADSRDVKVGILERLSLDVFVDDLPEVLLHPRFPARTRRILFAEPKSTGNAALRDSVGTSDITSLASWRDICVCILGELTDSDVVALAEAEWPHVPITAVRRIPGHGNSRIFQVYGSSHSYALKSYPDLRFDQRPRRATEWLALTESFAFGLPVPRPIATSDALNWSLLDWVEGVRPDPDLPESLAQAVHLVDDLRALSKSPGTTFGLATEACLRPSQVLEQIDARIARLTSVQDANLVRYLRDEIKPARDVATIRAISVLGKAWGVELAPSLRVLSPSDFGFHNALKTMSGRVVFFDFEYFGWDDPVKLVADFLLHPGSSLGLESQRRWISDMVTRFAADDEGFIVRLDACLNLYAVRWALIMLNEFLGDKSRNRLHARGTLEGDLLRFQASQLKKSRNVLRTKLPNLINGDWQ
jgi:hypothetical protein